MEKLAAVWVWVGNHFKRRPVAVVGFVLGAVLFASAMGYLLIEQNSNANDIHKVQEVICNSSGPYTEQIEANCRHLLDQLLKHPTPQQAERLKQIIKETP